MMAPKSEPKIKPTTTSNAVMPECHKMRSGSQMRAASLHTLENPGNTNSGMPSQPGPYSHSSKVITNKPRLQATVT
jgi:hypothetical protein